jgi:hypothetical protein
MKSVPASGTPNLLLEQPTRIEPVPASVILIRNALLVAMGISLIPRRIAWSAFRTQKLDRVLIGGNPQ